VEEFLDPALYRCTLKTGASVSTDAAGRRAGRALVMHLTRVFFSQSVPGAQALMAAEMSFAETHRLGSDGEEAPFAGHALEFVRAALLELKS
jgi:hypothetical protein